MEFGGSLRNVWRGCVVFGVLAVAVAGCTSEEKKESGAAANYFGPGGYGKLTVGMPEKDALATGDLQASPVSTVLSRNVYSFVGGPTPDPSRMAADEKIEKAVKAAETNSGTSAADYAKDAKAYADSTQRVSDRLLAYLSAGGATFQGGTLVSIAAPPGAATEAGIRRGSSITDLKKAYQSKGLDSSSQDAYELPAAGHPGWRLVFELDGNIVKYMSLGKTR